MLDVINHSTGMKDLLLSQFKNSPNINTFVEIYGTQLNQADNELLTLIKSLGLADATDYALDLIGKEVGQSRNGLSDADYRERLLLKIFINNSQGTVEDLISASKLLFSTDGIDYSEVYPAAVLLHVDTSNQELIDNYSILKQVLPAGVDLIYEIKVDTDPAINYAACAYSHILEFEVNPPAPVDLLSSVGRLLSNGRLSTATRLFT